MKPLRLTPPCKDYIWGGTRLREEYGKVSDKEKIAESWELSCHPDGTSVIAEGEFAGMKLTEYLAQAGDAVLGLHAQRFSAFPVLIKLIDAKDNLSVQVHPDNAYAQRVEGEFGKTEMWYIVDCDEGASLIYGFRDEISEEEFRERIEHNTLLDVVNTVPVKKGDVFFIEAGTLHAIGKGILIAEIQQNSNTTYRVYDYGRVGADGKPRELHIDKAIDVTERRPAPPYQIPAPVVTDGCTATQLAACEYFTVKRLEIAGSAQMNADETSFHHLLCLNGDLTVAYHGEEMAISKGGSILIPAALGAYSINGTGTALLTTI
ncbi:MAG: class I mannose-6-phosphate isomerase [Ruminococcus sp.]|nr:class I mannose-6-phosphate isomerase [Ruminococcus sp.]